MAEGEVFAELEGRENKEALPASKDMFFFACSPNVLENILVGGKRVRQQIDRKRIQRAGKVREKGHQPQGQISSRRGLQRKDRTPTAAEHCGECCLPHGKLNVVLRRERMVS